MAKNDLIVRLIGDDKLTPTLDSARKALSDMGRESSRLEDVRKNFERITQSGAPLSKKISDIRRQMQTLAQEGQTGSPLFKEMARQAQELKAQLREVDDAINGITDKKGGFDLKGMATDLTSKMGLGNIGSALTAISGPAAAAAAGVALVGKTFVDAGKKAAEFEVTLDNLQALTGLSDDEMPKLNNAILDLSKNFGASAQSIGSAMGFIGSQRPELLGSVEALTDVTDAALVLAKVGDMDVTEAASAITSAMNQFGVSSNEAADIINVMSAAQQQGSASVQYLTEVMNKSGAMAQRTGMDYGQLVAWTESVAGKFPEAAVAGTQFNAVLMGLSKNGINPTVEELQKLRDSHLSTEEAMKLVGQGNARMLFAMLDNIDTFQEFNSSIRDTAAAYDQYNIKVDNMEGFMNRLKATWDAFLITLGQSGFLQGMLDNIMLLMNSLGQVIDVLGDIIKAFDAFGIEGGGSVSLVQKQIEFVCEVIKGLGKVIEGIIRFFAKCFNAVRDKVAEVAESAAKKWGEFKDKLKDIAFVRTLIKAFQAVLDKMREWIGKLKELWNKFLRWLGMETKEIEKGEGVTLKANVEIEEETTTTSTSTTGAGKGKKGKTAKVKVKVEPEEGSIKALEALLQKLNDELANTVVSDERLQEINKEKEALEEQIRLLKERNGLEKVKEQKRPESKPSIAALEKDKYFEAGSLEDLRQSHANAQSRAQQVKADLQLGIISDVRAATLIDEINNELASLDLPTIDLHVNYNGDDLITAQEEVEERLKFLQDQLDREQKKIEDVQEAIGSLGGAFGALGGAIGGAGGEIMNFTGKTLDATAKIIPELIKLITANQAAATAEGVTSAAGVPFPGNIAAIAGIVATIAGIFASLPKFASGGIVGGGSFVGDRMLARVNSGEMILNGSQQANLFHLLESGRPDAPAIPSHITLKAKGNDLVAVIDTTNDKKRRQS